MPWDERQRLDDLGVNGIQRELTQAILCFCEASFGNAMTPAVGMDGDAIGISLQGQSGVIDITVSENGLVSFAGYIQHTGKGPTP